MSRSALVLASLASALLATTSTAQQPQAAPTPAPAAAAAPRGSDIWVATLAVADEAVSVRRVVNATARPGYDNQPHFLPGGQAFLYTSQRGTQTDIYEMTLDPHGDRQVTDTQESEYSPTLTPDGTTISVIRVEADTTQRLWRFPLTGTAAPSLILTDIRPVGYHAWSDPTTIALFVLGQPATLRIASTTTQQADTVASDIGRSLHLMPGGQAFSFTSRAGGQPHTLKRIDIATRAIVTLIAMPEGTQDYAWMPNGMAIAASGDRLLVWRDGWADWREATFTKPAGMGAISRLAVSPGGDRLAIVAEER